MYEACTFSNVTVRGYINPTSVNGTNDLTGQYVFVDMKTAALNQVVNIAGAQTIAAAAAAQWATYPASASVNLNRHDLIFSENWKASVDPSSAALSFTFNGSPAFKYTPALAGSGTNAFISSFMVTTTNLQFVVSSAATNPPTMFMSLTLDAPVWVQQTPTTNWASGAYWNVWLPKLTNDAAFFRASVATNAPQPAKFEVNGKNLLAGITTNVLFFNGATTNTLHFTAGILTGVTP
jgi:hypothetical protein